MIRAILMASALLLSGCASIMRGTTDELVVDTDPRGAQCTTEAMKGGKIKAAHYCKNTPCTYELKRNTDPISKCTLENYDSVTFSHAIDDSHAYYVLGNLFFGGIIGIIVDWANRATRDFESQTIKLWPATSKTEVTRTEPGSEAAIYSPASDPNLPPEVVYWSEAATLESADGMATLQVENLAGGVAIVMTPTADLRHGFKGAQLVGVQHKGTRSKVSDGTIGIILPAESYWIALRGNGRVPDTVELKLEPGKIYELAYRVDDEDIWYPSLYATKAME